MKIFQPKIFTLFKSYSKKQLINDIIAGLIVAIIALPLSIALAIASGVSPEQGLYTAIVAGFVISLLGGSKVNISGPTAAFATIVAGIVLDYQIEGLVIATLLAGLILILLGLFKVGGLIRFIPKSITIGFTSGIAITILVGQIKDFLGLTYPAGTSPIETSEKFMAVIENIATINWWALGVGAFALAILILWPKVSKKIPGSLIAVLAGTIVVLLSQIDVTTIGNLYTISSDLPKFNFPTINLDTVLELIPSAFTIALLAGIESLLSCVVSDRMIDDKHNPNTELIALGLGNICSGLFGGIPATGAIARTAANVRNGGRSPISGIVHAIVLLLILLLLMPYASLIPMPVIAAILFMVAYNMSEWREFIHVIKEKSPADICVLVLTFVLTVVFDLVVAIIVGLAVHYALFFTKKLITYVKAKKTGKEIIEEEIALNEMVDPEESEVAFGSVEGLPLNQDENSEL